MLTTLIKADAGTVRVAGTMSRPRPWECGADLAGAADLGVAASCQLTGIPFAAAQVIQHDSG
ncbi:MAG: hypothetical protein M3Y33_13445 [Actinomycetota bacterium]|nr:hypothetical protein [Actinomycetota bacterium]